MIRFDNGVAAKLLEKHNVTTKEVSECFANSEAIYIIDETEDHKTDPPHLLVHGPDESQSHAEGLLRAPRCRCGHKNSL
jgi:uncharacterized DUF497 family protein